MSRSALCAIAMGGNLGETEELFEFAVSTLQKHHAIEKLTVSPSYQTAPVGTAAQGDFLNAALTCYSTLSPLEMLHLCQHIETLAGRIRSVRWGSRTLDLDLIFHASHVVNTSELQIPHPAMWYRRFVLEPLVRLAPDWHHPVRQMSLKQCYQQILTRPYQLLITHNETTTQTALIAEIKQAAKLAFETSRLEIHALSEREKPSHENQSPTNRFQTYGMQIDLTGRFQPETIDFPASRFLSTQALPTVSAQAVIDILHSILDEPKPV